MSFLKSANIIEDAADLAACGGGGGVLQDLQALLQKWFGVSTAAGAPLSMCLPSSDNWNTFRSSFDDKRAKLVEPPAMDACLAKNCKLKDVGDGGCDAQCNNAACDFGAYGTVTVAHATLLTPPCSLPLPWRLPKHLPSPPSHVPCRVCELRMPHVCDVCV